MSHFVESDYIVCIKHLHSFAIETERRPADIERQKIDKYERYNNKRWFSFHFAVIIRKFVAINDANILDDFIELSERRKRISN